MNSAWDVIVIGAGAAGLMAAIHASERGLSTLVLEKNRKPGVKILISGGTRCNFTHATDRRGIIDAFGRQGRFLRWALDSFGPDELVDFIEAEGVKTKTESTGKTFPVSDRAFDVLRAFLDRLGRTSCELRLGEPVIGIRKTDKYFEITTDRHRHIARKVAITVGGQSYPGCGTIGDGYAWAREFGHTIVTPRPALVPLTSNSRWLADLQGITIPDAQVSVWRRDNSFAREFSKRLEQRRGSLLFAHFGVSGPCILDISRVVTNFNQRDGTQSAIDPNPGQLELQCDFLPDLALDNCHELIRREAEVNGRRHVSNWLSTLVPKRLAEAICDRHEISRDHRLAELSRTQRALVISGLKSFAMLITGTRGFKKAEVTAGGVDLSEVDSKSMQSRLISGLYFAGEILDIDGPIGGYNFQAAFSTGFLAGNSV